MKKILMFVAVLLIPVQSMAAGLYDGIWQIIPGTYISVHQRDNELAIILVEVGEEWNALAGTISGNAATVTSAAGPMQATARITFNSATSATVVLITCSDPTSPNPACAFPNGVPIPVTKVF